MNIRLGDNVRVLSGRYKGEVMTVEKMDTNSMGITWLYLTKGQIVIFRTTKQIDLVRE
jgi:ribosomal protein L24